MSRPISIPTTGYSNLSLSEVERLDNLRAGAFANDRDEQHSALLTVLSQCEIEWINLVPSLNHRGYDIDTYDDQALVKLLDAGIEASEDYAPGDPLHVIYAPYGKRQLYGRDDVLFLLSVIDRLTR